MLHVLKDWNHTITNIYRNNKCWSYNIVGFKVCLFTKNIVSDNVNYLILQLISNQCYVFDYHVLQIIQLLKGGMFESNNFWLNDMCMLLELFR